MRSKDKFALFYGVLVGDGCISLTGKGYYVSLTCDINSDQEMINKLVPIIEQIRRKKIKVYQRPKYGKIEINFSDKNLFEKLVRFNFPIGKKGTKLKISNQLDAFFDSVIKGYFATDGCLLITNNNGTNYPRLEISSISYDILKQVKDKLEDYGINSNIYISHKQKDNSNTLYRIQINGKKNLILFNNHIGFFNPKHHVKFTNFCDNFIKD